MKSKCCKTEMVTNYGEEGTNSWCCTACDHACDPYVEPELGLYILRSIT